MGQSYTTGTRFDTNFPNKRYFWAVVVGYDHWPLLPLLFLPSPPFRVLPCYEAAPYIQLEGLGSALSSLRLQPWEDPGRQTSMRWMTVGSAIFRDFATKLAVLTTSWKFDEHRTSRFWDYCVRIWTTKKKSFWNRSTTYSPRGKHACGLNNRTRPLCCSIYNKFSK